MEKNLNIQELIKEAGTKSPSPDFTSSIMAAIEQSETQKISLFDKLSDKYEKLILFIGIISGFVFLFIWDLSSEHSHLKEIDFSALKLQLPEFQLPEINIPIYITMFLVVLPVLYLFDKFLSTKLHSK